MSTKREEMNNRGFSLIELVVVVAIMALMVGMGSLAVSLLIGSEAKQAAEKIGAQLNEVKTGSMSRYSEDLNIVYVPDASLYDWADREGYYAVKQMTTLGATGSGTYMPTEVALGAEHRYLCNSRVKMTLTTTSGGGSYDIDSTTAGIGFTFDRATGLYDNVKTNCVLTGSGAIDEPNVVLVSAQPQTLDITSGLKTYHITFINDTGKHKIEQ